MAKSDFLYLLTEKSYAIKIKKRAWHVLQLNPNHARRFEPGSINYPERKRELKRKLKRNQRLDAEGEGRRSVP